MFNSYSPRVMIAGVCSGAGKTTLTCGILEALIKRNISVSAFKCGPDYIDTMFHSKVLGLSSSNLDSFLLNEDTIKYLIYKNARNTNLSIIEGVMGYYDGIAGTTTMASSYEVSNITSTPVILVVDCKGMSTSLVAIIEGFLKYKPNNNIKGVILNHISPSLYKEIKKVIEATLRIEVIGYLPNIKGVSIKSRHLGLVTADEIEDIKQKLNLLAHQVEETIEIDKVLRIAMSAPYIKGKLANIKSANFKQKLKVAVAKDKAFCFYYKDSINILEDMGAEIIYFSPLNDECLPSNINGLILGGGYPELYAEGLSKNVSMLKSVKLAIKKGIPCIAECGGFMYLHNSIEDANGEEFNMVGIINAKSFKTDKLKRFGYATILAKRDNLICKKGENIPTHEFHYWDSTNAGVDFIAEKPIKGLKWDCIYADENIFAGYPHIHMLSNTNIAHNFLIKCLKYGSENNEFK